MKKSKFKSRISTFYNQDSKFTAKSIERYLTQFIIWQRQDNQKYFCDLWVNNTFDSLDDIKSFLDQI